MNLLKDKEGKPNWKYILIVVILAVIVGRGALWLSAKQEAPFVNLPFVKKSEKTEDEVFMLLEALQQETEVDSPNKDKIDTQKYLSDSNQFRNQTIKFVRETAENYFDGQEVQYPRELEIRGDWEPYITIYHQGEVKGQGKGRNEILSFALAEATEIALSDERCKNLTKKDLGDIRFLVKFLYPPDQFSFVEYNGEGKELIGDLVVIRDLDKELIRQKIEQGKEFLYKVMHKDEHGFYKKYDALNDDFEDRLHTVYSASIIYTFLYIYDLEKDERILPSTISQKNGLDGQNSQKMVLGLEHFSDWGDFLLSMQNKDREDKRYGAFHYSYYLNEKEREKKFVVGTSALSIFTLLRLYNLTNDSKYLESARLAGNWLTTMQEPDGSMKPYVRYSEGQWVYGKKESLLYNGQVLSALSKLYKVTGERKYYDTAERIAQRFVGKYEKEKACPASSERSEDRCGGYIEGEYRKKNPISNSWVVMSLMDFYRVNQDGCYKDIIFELSEKVLANQRNNAGDLLSYGTWVGAYSTSGTGWISEVMAEMYRFCKEQNREPRTRTSSVRGRDCDKYKDSVIKAIRWLIQNTYSEENTFFLKNPERAIGGVFWSKLKKYVRTDSVCHALNSYIIIMNDLENGLLLSVSEEPFEVILNELKK